MKALCHAADICLYPDDTQILKHIEEPRSYRLITLLFF